MKILNKSISGWLNNNYFPLNESSSSTNNNLLVQLKNYSKTFNELISTPYSYPKQTTLLHLGLSYWPNIQWFVTCLSCTPFLFSWLWIYLETIINFVLKVWTKHDFAMLQTLGDFKFQWRQVGLKSQPFSMWVEAKLLRHYKFSSG